MTEIILTSSVLILLLVLLRQVLRGRISPCAQYALWLLVAARLLIPGTLFTAPVSVLGAAESFQTSFYETFPAPDRPAAPATGAGQSAQPEPPLQPAAPVRTEYPNGDAVVTYPPAAPESPRQAYNWPDIIWKAGIAITGGVMAVSNLVFYFRLKKSRKRLDLPAEQWSGDLPVYEADGLPSPCLSGLFRPAVYLNEAAMEAEHPEHILAHEYAHYRHGDHLWSILRSICLVIHWYNPLVWWAAALSRRDCELACDASALRRLGEAERIGYGQTLLGMVSRQTSPAALFHTATTMTAGKRAMAERIALIARRPKTRKITLALAAMLACALAACTFGGAAEKGASGESALMEYPGLHWNDTPESVMETLGITEEDVLEKAAMDNGETCRTWEFVVENPGFDPDAQYAIFHFSQYWGTGYGLGLDLVKLCYPEDMKDFDALRDAFGRQYGEGGKSDYGPYTGQVVADSLDDHHAKREIDAILGDRGGRWEELEAQTGPHCFFWDAGVDTLPREQSETFAAFYRASGWQDAYPGPSSENIPEYPAMVRLSWEDNSLERFTFNEVTYDARNYVLLLQNSSPLETASPLYEFPGLHWNDSMETVMETLGITEEDFVESGEENSSDTETGFYFVIGDVPLNGRTAQYLICRFIQYKETEHEPGLYAVQVNYPDGMEDFDAVREELLRQYGPADEETRGRGYPATDGFKAALGDRYGRWEELQQQTGNNTARWKAGAEVLPEAYMRPLETALKGWQSRYPDMTMEDYVAEFPVASLTWCSASVFTPTFNTVTFNGGSYVYCLQYSSVGGAAREAGIIVSQVQGGGSPGGWLPYLNYMDWADIRQAAVDAGLDDGDGSGFAQNVLEDIAGYVDRRSPVIEESTYVSILTATEGLHDELLEAYRFLVYRLHAADPGMFAYVVLEQLPQEQKDFILDCFRYEYRYEMAWEHTPGDGKDMPSREEAIAELEREMGNTVTASPETMVLTRRGQSFRFLPENAHGVYAATYSSNNPEVAEVAQDGTVTARNYGETYIILHFEGAQGQQDFSCHVRCELEGGSEAAAASIRSQVQAGVSPREWIPLLEEISWNELNVPEDGHDWIRDVQQALYDYILTQRTRTGSTLGGDELLTLLSCTDGLDGAYAEGYSVILYAIYNLHPSLAAKDILMQLSPEQQEETLELLFFEWGYQHRLGDDLSYEEQLNLLREQLEADRMNSLPLYPDALLFTSVGTVSQIHLVRPYDTVYVSCESSDPEVASVEARGDGIFDVTAVGPGEAAITVHCRNDGEDRDAVCSVFCSW